MSISKESLNGDVLTLPTGEKSKNGEVFNMSTSGESIQNVSTLPTSIERMADISTNDVSDVEQTNGVGKQYLINEEDKHKHRIHSPNQENLFASREATKIMYSYDRNTLLFYRSNPLSVIKPPYMTMLYIQHMGIAKTACAGNQS